MSGRTLRPNPSTTLDYFSLVGPTNAASLSAAVAEVTRNIFVEAR